MIFKGVSKGVSKGSVGGQCFVEAQELCSYSDNHLSNYTKTIILRLSEYCRIIPSTLTWDYSTNCIHFGFVFDNFVINSLLVTGHFRRQYHRRNKKFVINLHFNEFPPDLSRNQICK